MSRALLWPAACPLGVELIRTSAVPEPLLAFARASEPALRALLDEKVRSAARLPLDLTPAFERLREYVLRGGKRLRGALCLLGCAAGGGSGQEAFPAALGLELFHAYLLVHDDFMDRDQERRGGPTLHVAFAQPGAVAAAPNLLFVDTLQIVEEPAVAREHTAGSLAILFGSLCQAWALEQIFASPVAPERTLAAARLIARALGEVTLGQALDVAAPLAGELPRSAALRIEELKTGSYTFALPLRLGALLAGASQETQDALAAYAHPLGKAFQIADDLLGTFGAPEQTGKSAGNDLREGKRTLLVLRALEAASPADVAALREGLGRHDLSEAGVEELRAILRRSGAEAFARAEAARLCDESVAALASLSIPRAVAEELRAIARYAVQRDS